MSAPTNLPAAEWQYPLCGACWSVVESDGDSFVCYPCGLSFDREHDLSASYLDDEIEPCGAPCGTRWHGDDRNEPGKAFDCGTCALPKGHESGHWTGCRVATRSTPTDPKEA